MVEALRTGLHSRVDQARHGAFGPRKRVSVRTATAVMCMILNPISKNPLEMEALQKEEDRTLREKVAPHSPKDVQFRMHSVLSVAIV